MEASEKTKGGFGVFLIILGFIAYLISLFTDFFVSTDANYPIEVAFEDVAAFGTWGSFGAILIIFLSVAGPCLAYTKKKSVALIGLIMPVACLALSVRELVDIIVAYADSVPAGYDLEWSIGLGGYCYLIGMLLMIIGALIGLIANWKRPEKPVVKEEVPAD